MSLEAYGKPAEYLRRAKELEASPGERVRLAILASFSAQFLRPYLVVEGAELGLSISPWVGPFGQLEQPVLDGSSALWALQPHAIWLALRLEDVDRHWLVEASQGSVETTRARLARVTDRLTTLAQAIRQRSPATILVSTLEPGELLDDPFDDDDPDSARQFVLEANRALARKLRELPDAFTIDPMRGVPEELRRDARLWYSARALSGHLGNVGVARRLGRILHAIRRPAAKCIVVDLDNTLWGGVLGEDGLGGIKFGAEYPGNVFRDVQAFLLFQRSRGALLAVASKNDPADVELALGEQEMILRREHFAAVEAGWQPKAESLRRIAQSLKLGLDSFVFVDDNPVERAAIRAELPMVTVVELPADPLGYLPALRASPAFDRPRILAEDRARAEMVQQDRQREVLSTEAPDLESFLSSLQMVATVGLADASTIERIHQLLHKTNQFNLTTRRHALDEVRRLAEAPNAKVAWLRLSDRFGELGLVCVGILRARSAETWEVDTLLMSCRVMGRRVEDAFLSYLGELVARAGARELIGLFRSSPKNEPVRSFWKERGGSPTTTADETQEYLLDPGSLPRWPSVIRRLGAKEQPR